MNDFAERMNHLSPEKRALLLRRMQERVRAGAQLIQRRENQAAYPVSFAQQRMWFLEQMETTVALYNITTTIEIRRLQEAAGVQQALVLCLNEILRRHEVLRASFSFEDGQLVQQIRPTAELAIPIVDLQELPAAERPAALAALAQAEVVRRFDMARDLLLRAQLVQLAPDLFHLLLTVHHSVFDAWSVGLLAQEIEALFAAMLAGAPLARPPLEIQYADFAAWQRASLQGELLERQLGYWQQQLAGPLPVLDLPTDRPRPAQRTINGALQAFRVPAAVSTELRRLSQRHEATLFMTLLAVWSLLLHNYSDQDDLLIGTPIANRHHREIEQLIGCFVNTLVLRVRLSASASFAELLREVRQTALDAYANQDLPFEALVDALQIERDVSRTPLFQVLFALQNTPLHNASVNILSELPGPARFDLTLTMSDAETELAGVLEYNTDLFAAATIERLLGHFVQLLTTVAAQPTAPLSTLTLLTPAERARLLLEWNATAHPYPATVGIHELFEAQAARAPAQVALVAEGAQRTYAELNERANQLAGRLRELGAGRGTLVGVLCRRSIAMVEALLGVLKAGAAYVPLDPAYPAARLAHMVADAGIELLLTQQELLDSAQAHLPASATWLCLDAPGALDDLPTDNLASVTDPDDLAYVIYTSGSTGLPKGVQLRHRGLCNLAQEQIRGFELGPTSRVLQMASFSFDASVSEIFTTLLAGATLYLPPPTLDQGGLEVLALLERYAISVVTLSPALLRVLPPTELPALATLVVAGEPCSAEIVRAWGQGRRLLNAYGPTEATVCATMMLCDPAADSDPPIGRPLGNVQVYLLNRHLQPVPVGVPGEIYIGGVGVAQGYIGRPELNHSRFLSNPFAPGTLYRTGDIGRYLPDGTLAYLGRKDDQLKVRGFRIEVGEIEHALLEQPGVTGAVVVAQRDATAGLRLIGYVTVAPELAPAEVVAAASAGLQQRLPGYMLPAALLALAAFPVTANNKLDRRALAERPLELPQLSGPRRAPETVLEQTIATVWAEVLGHAAIGTNDNFFDLGGNSLSMIKVLGGLTQALERELTISTLFRFPTISALARHLHAEADSALSQAGQRQGARQREALLRQRRRGRG